MRAEESTALYDAVVYSLYNFLGVKGQKALVLRHRRQGHGLEVHVRAGARVRAARGRADLRDRHRHPRHRHRLEVEAQPPHHRDRRQRRTTSRTSPICQKIYADIQNELRSQYVLGFYPAADVKSGGKWREVTVQVAEGKVKTIRGYYP